MDGNEQATIGKMQTQGNRHIVCITHPTETEYQVHEIDDYSEDQLEDEEEEDIIEQTMSKGNKKMVSHNDGQLYNSIYVNGDLDEQHQDGQSHQQHQHHHHQHNQHNSKILYSNDADERFLLSCLPTLQRLPKKKNALARLKIQQTLFDLEFEEEMDGLSSGNDGRN